MMGSYRSLAVQTIISGVIMARPERFERPTPRFVVWCSIQLSYGRALEGAQ